MADAPEFKPSFSAARRWGIRLDYVLRTAVVLALVGMVNYLGAYWYYRTQLSSHTRQVLAPLTVNLLRSLTNDIKVTLFYDKEDPLFTTVSALLKDYQNVHAGLRVKAVDYRWDAAEAESIKKDYASYFVGLTNKNLIIFDCGGRVKVVNGNALAEYVPERVANETELEFRRKPVAFLGEKMFTAALLAVTSPRPFKACFLTGHGEHPLDGADESGYLAFSSVLRQNFIQPVGLSLVGTNVIPADCDLLVIAGPMIEISSSELEKVQRYLQQGGRLMALLNSAQRTRQTGLEQLLVRWNMIVGESPVVDPEQTESATGSDVVISAYAKHPLVNSMIGYGLYLIQPRPISAMELRSRDGGAPKIQPVAFTGTNAVMAGNLRGPRRQYAVAAVVEDAVPGVVTERGATRILAVGDSLFLDNQCLEKWANRDFAGYAVNWLLERTQLLEGLGPRPITEFRITMTRAQTRTVQWILLAAMPGAVLFLGGLVWLRRRS